MANILGTGKDDILATGEIGDSVYAQGGQDNVAGGAGDDLIMAGGGNDTVTGGTGNDIIYGAKSLVTGFNDLRVSEATKAHVTVDETGTHRDVVGMYTYNSAGQVTGVKLLEDQKGHSEMDAALAKGDRLAFFVVPDGVAKGDTKWDALFAGAGTFKMVGSTGEQANVLLSKGISLVYTDPVTGLESKVAFPAGTTMLHSLAGLNASGKSAFTTTIDAKTGDVKLVWEDASKQKDADRDSHSDSHTGSGTGSGDGIDDDGHGHNGDKHDDRTGDHNDDGHDDQGHKDKDKSKDTHKVVINVNVGVTVATEMTKPKTASGQSDHDLLSGGEGNDVLYGLAGNDTIDGGTGNDVLSGHSGKDSLSGGEGDDVLNAGKDDDQLDGGAGNDKLFGNSGNDELRDSAGDDAFKGGTGDDKVIASLGGKDAFDGGKGNDTIDFGDMGGKHGITLNLAKHTVVNGKFTDSVTGFENAYGTDLTDKMTGSKRADSLYGEGGDDLMRGKLGSDILTGGAGRDTFEFQKDDWAKGSIDHITDFVKGQDVLDLNEIISGKIGKSGPVMLTDAKDGTHLSVVISGKFQEIAILDDVHGLTVADLSSAGSLII
jgi:Ca2+-binding RTX toxin-like protein